MVVKSEYLVYVLILSHVVGEQYNILSFSTNFNSYFVLKIFDCSVKWSIFVISAILTLLGNHQGQINGLSTYLSFIMNKVSMVYHFLPVVSVVCHLFILWFIYMGDCVWLSKCNIVLQINKCRCITSGTQNGCIMNCFPFPHCRWK